MLSCSTLKCLFVIFSAALVIIKLSRWPCVDLHLKGTELSWGVGMKKSRGEQNEAKRRMEQKRGDASLAGAAEAGGAEVNVDFYT